jgi:hypothetical protein
LLILQLKYAPFAQSHLTNQSHNPAARLEYVIDTGRAAAEGAPELCGGMPSGIIFMTPARWAKRFGGPDFDAWMRNREVHGSSRAEGGNSAGSPAGGRRNKRKA